MYNYVFNSASHALIKTSSISAARADMKPQKGKLERMKSRERGFILTGGGSRNKIGRGDTIGGTFPNLSEIGC